MRRMETNECERNRAKSDMAFALVFSKPSETFSLVGVVSNYGFAMSRVGRH